MHCSHYTTRVFVPAQNLIWYNVNKNIKQKPETSNMVESFSLRLKLPCSSWKMVFHVWTQKSKWDNMKALQYSVNTIEPYNPAHPAYLLITGTLLENLTITKGERKAYSGWGLPNKSTEGHEWLLTDTWMIDAITYIFINPTPTKHKITYMYNAATVATWKVSKIIYNTKRSQWNSTAIFSNYSD